MGINQKNTYRTGACLIVKCRLQDRFIVYWLQTEEGISFTYERGPNWVYVKQIYGRQ